MGNCSLKAAADGECSNNIKLVTESEGIIELKGPKLAIDILNLYPGYGIFRRTKHGSFPLGTHEYLINGQFYYLLPLQELPLLCDGEAVIRREDLEVLPWQGNGVWKVKLVISSQELEEILSEGNAEALIEKMRMAAASFAPARRRKSFWGGVGSSPGIFNVFKVSPIDVPK